MVSGNKNPLDTVLQFREDISRITKVVGNYSLLTKCSIKFTKLKKQFLLSSELVTHSPKMGVRLTQESSTTPLLN